MSEDSSKMKKVKCNNCGGNGWWIDHVTLQISLPFGKKYKKVVVPCYNCNQTGVLEVEDPDNLVKQSQEVKNSINEPV